ncbi:hypothetical protein D3C87_941730 [compost metagenome]
MNNQAFNELLEKNTIRSMLFKVKKNQLQMLKNRGYDIGAEEGTLTTDIRSFITFYDEQSRLNKKSFREMMNGFYSRPDDNVYVYFLDTPSDKAEIGKAQITAVMEQLNKDLPTVRHVILIAEIGISSDSRTVLSSLPSYHFEFFMYEDLAYNPTENFLASKHTLLTEGQKYLFLNSWPEEDGKKKKININNLPGITIHDPISKYYGGKAGDIFFIQRPDITGKTLIKDPTLFYRAAVDRPISRFKITAATKTAKDVDD